MKRVLKAQEEPATLADYKARFAAAPAEHTWSKFKRERERREQVKAQLRADQRGLCAYCENALIPEDESVEHFVARYTEHLKELVWTNLLLCCAGGERPLPEDVADGGVRYDPAGPRTCGHAKLNCEDPILNPLDLPHTPRLFRFKSESGEILPDEDKCRRTGVDVQRATETVRVLGLTANRLNRARLALLTTLMEHLAEAGATLPFSQDRERELASIHLQQTGDLPAFFTTIRYVLGAGAEVYLSSIGFEG